MMKSAILMGCAGATSAEMLASWEETVKNVYDGDDGCS
jgi:hypothetical protein